MKFKFELSVVVMLAIASIFAGLAAYAYSANSSDWFGAFVTGASVFAGNFVISIVHNVVNYLHPKLKKELAPEESSAEPNVSTP